VQTTMTVMESPTILIPMMTTMASQMTSMIHQRTMITMESQMT
jgi:hypothetical protein